MIEVHIDLLTMEFFFVFQDENGETQISPRFNDPYSAIVYFSSYPQYFQKVKKFAFSYHHKIKVMQNVFTYVN